MWVDETGWWFSVMSSSFYFCFDVVMWDILGCYFWHQIMTSSWLWWRQTCENLSAAPFLLLLLLCWICFLFLSFISNSSNFHKLIPGTYKWWHVVMCLSQYTENVLPFKNWLNQCCYCPLTHSLRVYLKAKTNHWLSFSAKSNKSHI